MLHKVEAGNVITVITKDLSRLGRNYLKTGDLIEIVFPEYEVRYIAISDGVDTAREAILHNARIYRTALVKRIWLALCSRVTRKF